MATTQPQYKTITSPLGSAMWTKLDAPEMSFALKEKDIWKQGGYYEVIIRINGEDSVDLRNLITEAYDAAVNQSCNEYLAEYVEKKPAQKGKFKDLRQFMADKQPGVNINALPFKQLEDESGELIDLYEFKFKQWARGSKDGEHWDIAPRVVGPDGKAYDVVPCVGHGSILRAQFQLKGYGMKNEKTGNRAPSIGLSTPMVASQIWELNEFKRGGGGFDDASFDANPDAPALAAVAANPFDDSGENIPF
mgnify:CR=1 FL=1